MFGQLEEFLDETEDEVAKLKYFLIGVLVGLVGGWASHVVWIWLNSTPAIGL